VAEQVQVYLDDCQGDFVLRGWDESELKIQSQGSLDENTVQQAADVVRLSTLSEGRLFVPRQATVIIGHVAGDLRADGLTGSLEVGRVEGDLRVKGGTLHVHEVQGDCVITELTGNVTIDAASGDVSLREVAGEAVVRLIGGDLRVRRINGTLRAEEVHGNVHAKNLDGALELARVGGDTVLTNLQGGVKLHQAQGEVVLKTGLASGVSYHVQANGDIALKLSLPTSAHLVLEAPSGEIYSTVPLKIEEKAVGRLAGILGQADKPAEVFLHTSSGNIMLKPLTMFEDKFPEQAGAHFDARVIAGMAQAHVMAGPGTANGDDFLSREAEQALQRAERVRIKAERAAERAQRHMARQAERIAERWHLTWHGKRAAPRRAAEPVTEEERLAVLKMLQEGKITAEEANKLLEALEG
jgi:DUF4097 and DUF4098 domain-containing protein YvlB